MRLAMVAAVLAVMLCAGSIAQASSTTEFVGTALEWAKDTVTAPDAVGVSLGDPLLLSFSKKVDLVNIAGVASVDGNAGLAIAMTGPAIRGQVSIGLTNVKGNRLCLGVVTERYDEATWKVDLGPLGRIGLEPRVTVNREF